MVLVFISVFLIRVCGAGGICLLSHFLPFPFIQLPFTCSLSLPSLVSHISHPRLPPSPTLIGFPSPPFPLFPSFLKTVFRTHATLLRHHRFLLPSVLLPCQLIPLLRHHHRLLLLSFPLLPSRLLHQRRPSPPPYPPSSRVSAAAIFLLVRSSMPCLPSASSRFTCPHFSKPFLCHIACET